MLLHFKTWPEQADVYDPFHPGAREIYWDNLSKHIFSLGMDAWWLDATEPEFDDKERRMDQPTHDGWYRERYNAFPLVSTGGIYDHQRSLTSDKRVTILTRSAFTGQQRYGTTCWSGDVMSTWESFHKQIPAGLNYAAIDFQWDEARRTLTIGPHEGRYPGMLEKRVFDIELGEQGRGSFDREGKPVKTVTYRGKPLTLKF